MLIKLAMIKTIHQNGRLTLPKHIWWLLCMHVTQGRAMLHGYSNYHQVNWYTRTAQIRDSSIGSGSQRINISHSSANLARLIPAASSSFMTARSRDWTALLCTMHMYCLCSSCSTKSSFYATTLLTAQLYSAQHSTVFFQNHKIADMSSMQVLGCWLIMTL